jgi:uncharacterized membrane protein YfcA
MDEMLFAMLIAALLYAAVGHGGASAYIAIFTLYGFSATEIRVEVLLMNMLVAGVSWLRFWGSGHFSWRYLLPFLPGSILMAALGTWLSFPVSFVSLLAGGALSVSAGWLIYRTMHSAESNENLHPFSSSAAFGWGAVIGFISGITGVGGGIFLSPLMAVTRRYPLKLISGMSAAFIVVNSAVGLITLNLKHEPTLSALHVPVFFLLLLPLASLAGSQAGNVISNLKVLRVLLALVLLIAALKLLMKGLA